MSVLPGVGGSSGIQIEDVPAMDRVRDPWAVDGFGGRQPPSAPMRTWASIPTRLGDRLTTHGPNELEKRAASPPGACWLEQFTSAMILVLLGAAAITAVIGDLKDTIVILVIVALNGVVGFIQEYRAEQAMDALKRMTSPNGARRSRRRRTTSSRRASSCPATSCGSTQGDIVTADMRLVEARSLRINEAALTGESEPVSKIDRSDSRRHRRGPRRPAEHGLQRHRGDLRAGWASSSRPAWRPALGRVAELLEEHDRRRRRSSGASSTLGK